jgi:ribosome-dependent ATPase
LQLAVACLHRPEVLILDEPTSGVDPAARDMFWRLLAELSRRDGATIFVSTHFMNEAERCDRLSLMHAGKVLAVGAPDELRRGRGTASLEEAFVGYLEDASGQGEPTAPPLAEPHRARAAPVDQVRPLAVSLGRVWAFARRELVEVWRDRVRLAFALLGPLFLMLTFGYGVTFDVEHLTFAVLDRDRSRESRELVQSFAGSRYFDQRAPLLDEPAIDRRLKSGELRLAVDIPPGFGRDLLRGHPAEVAFFLDGAMPFRAETARGYLEGVLRRHLEDFARRTAAGPPAGPPVRLEPRFRYNQAFASVAAILPGTIMVLMIIVPSMLAALGVVREREAGSISNFRASPATVGEFLIGKQIPYVLLGLASFLTLVALATSLFGLEVKGSAAALFLGAALYVFAATGLGLLVSTFVRSQVAAIIATAVICTVPAVNFSGYLYPSASLEGAGRLLGQAFPALWFQNVSLGVFAKGRPFEAFRLEYLVLFGFGVGFLAAARLLLRKQER